MRRTQYRDLTQAANWVKLKFGHESEKAGGREVESKPSPPRWRQKKDGFLVFVLNHCTFPCVFLLSLQKACFGVIPKQAFSTG